MSDSQRYYDILGLAPSAGIEEIRHTYRDLVHVWHPDRFSYNQRLKEKAEEKLKEINIAYEYVVSELKHSSENREAPKNPQEPPKEKFSKSSPKPRPIPRRRVRRYIRYLTAGILFTVLITGAVIYFPKFFKSSEKTIECQVMEDLEAIKRDLDTQLRAVDRKFEKTPLEYGEYHIVKNKKNETPGTAAKPDRKSDTLAMIPKYSPIREINKEQIEKLKELLDNDQRYVDNGNGTVTDKTTGLMWCLANSYLDLGRNMNYTDAKTYVRHLRAGGYSDWRIPTTTELAGIYVNKPFFPNIGAKWYWSSDIYNSGWHTVVAVIHPENREHFSRKYAKQTDVGAVHAVRD